MDKKEYLLRISRDLLAFGRVVAPDMFTRPSCDFHRELARDCMDPSLKRMNRIAPRGFAKSTICAEIYPLWHIFLEDLFLRQKRTPKFVLLVSKTAREAKNRLATMKQIIEDPRFRQLFGEWGQETAEQWSRGQVVLKDGTVISTRGTAQHVRGIKRYANRPTLIVLDDPEDEENTKTIERMEQNLEWVLQGLEPALADGGKMVVIGTPQHQRSMVMVLKDMEGWDTKLYQAIREVEDPDTGERRTESLWPENPEKSVQKLEEKRQSLRSIGRERMYFREYMCTIRSDANIFKSNYFRYWDGYLETRKKGSTYRHWLHVTHRDKDEHLNGLELEEKEVIPVFVTMGVDPASSKSRTASYSTIVPIATTPEGHIYVLPYFRARVSPYDHAHRIHAWFKRFRPHQTRVESIGYQTMLREYMLRSGDFDERIPGMEIPTKPPSKGGQMESKEDRIEGLQGLFADGKVHIKPSMRAFYDEFVLYPDAEHRDLADAFYYAQTARRLPAHRRESYDPDPDKSEKRKRPSRRDPMLA